MFVTDIIQENPSLVKKILNVKPFCGCYVNNFQVLFVKFDFLTKKANQETDLLKICSFIEAIASKTEFN